MFNPTLALNASMRWRGAFAVQRSRKLQPKMVSETDQQRGDRLARLSIMASRERAGALALAADTSARTTPRKATDPYHRPRRVLGSRNLLTSIFWN